MGSGHYCFVDLGAPILARKTEALLHKVSFLGVVSLHTELMNVCGVQERTYTRSTVEYAEYEKCTRSTGL